MHPRGKNVVGVTGPGHGLAANGSAVLLERHHIGEHLAWMRATCETVDDRHGRVPRELGQHVMIERAHHDDVDVAREDPRRVGDGLPSPELHLLAGQQDGRAPELAHGDVEGYARAGRRLVEDHGKRAPLERARAAIAARFHGAARLDHPTQLLRGDVDEIEEVAAFHLAAPRFCSVSCALAMRAQARSRRLIASATSSSLMMSGGSSRTTLSPDPAAIIFSARNSSINSALGTTVRSPTRSPSPRSSATTVG